MTARVCGPHTTGLPYLTEQSDLDLIWPISDERTALSLVDRLRRLDAESPVRLGETYGDAQIVGGFVRLGLTTDGRFLPDRGALVRVLMCSPVVNRRAVRRGAG